MDPILWLGTGHGIKPDGTFDPGAVGADNRSEQEETEEVIGFAIAAAARCGIPTRIERGPSDPNYAGSIRDVNAHPSIRLAVELHYDYRLAPDTAFAYHHRTSSAGKRAAQAIASGFRIEGIPLRGDGVYTPQDYNRGDLAFLARTTPPAIIAELGRIYDHPVERNRRQAEAVIRGACGFLGVRYVSPGTPKPDPAPEPDPDPVDAGGPFRDVRGGTALARALERLKGAGIVHGYADGTYRPGEPMTRGQAALLIDALLAELE